MTKPQGRIILRLDGSNFWSFHWNCTCKTSEDRNAIDSGTGISCRSKSKSCGVLRFNCSYCWCISWSDGPIRMVNKARQDRYSIDVSSARCRPKSKGSRVLRFDCSYFWSICWNYSSIWITNQTRWKRYANDLSISSCRPETKSSCVLRFDGSYFWGIGRSYSSIGM